MRAAGVLGESESRRRTCDRVDAIMHIKRVFVEKMRSAIRCFLSVVPAQTRDRIAEHGQRCRCTHRAGATVGHLDRDLRAIVRGPQADQYEDRIVRADRNPVLEPLVDIVRAANWRCED